MGIVQDGLAQPPTTTSVAVQEHTGKVEDTGGLGREAADGSRTILFGLPDVAPLSLLCLAFFLLLSGLGASLFSYWCMQISVCK